MRTNRPVKVFTSDYVPLVLMARYSQDYYFTHSAESITVRYSHIENHNGTVHNYTVVQLIAV